MALRAITLTGVEESTDPRMLVEMTRSASGISVEWGVLYSPERAGLGGRYPSVAWIRDFARCAAGYGFSAALHVCGAGVEEFLRNAKAALNLSNGFHRVQLNFNQARRPVALADLDRLIGTLGRPVITQYNRENDRISRLITAPGHQLLVDASRGTGTLPVSWPAPIARKATGYAGGLGPDNLATEIHRITAVAGFDIDRSWVDMESKVINPEGRFDCTLAERAIEIVRAHAQAHGTDLAPEVWESDLSSTESQIRERL